MANILGMAAIRINGREIKTEGKSTLNPVAMPASNTWAAVRSGEFPQDGCPSIKLTIAADRDVDVIEISNWEDVTVMFYGDNGLNYMMTGAATDNPAELDEDAGTVSANFIGVKCVKV